HRTHLSRLAMSHVSVCPEEYSHITIAFLSQAPPMVPFRSMLLILRGGPESLAPRAYRKPIFPIALLGLDHGVGHFRPLSITRQRHLSAYHGTARSNASLCQVF